MPVKLKCAAPVHIRIISTYLHLDLVIPKSQMKQANEDRRSMSRWNRLTPYATFYVLFSKLLNSVFDIRLRPRAEVDIVICRLDIGPAFQIELNTGPTCDGRYN